jgi:hypothetical protein
MPDIFLEGDHPRIISAKFGSDWLSSFRGEDFLKISSPFFSIFSLVAILVGSQDHRTHGIHWMVLFQKCVRLFGPSTKMAPTAEFSLT